MVTTRPAVRSRVRLALVLTLAVLAGACSGTGSAGPGPSTAPLTTTSTATTSPLTTTSTTQPITTTTAAWAATSLAPTPEQAASELVDAWSVHDRAKALIDASPAAVAALFTNPYPKLGLDDRGCTSSPVPGAPNYCDYKSWTGTSIIEFTVTPVSRAAGEGWAVTGVLLEN
jgi:hypothetical protein